jgi:iron complex outermembrane recepter protein
MGNNRKLQFAIRAALAAATATAVVPAAFSQTAPAATAPDTSLQEVVVTGSRIQSPNLNSVSPITSVTAVEISQTGLTRVEDILNNLPSVYAGQTSGVSNGADGTSTINLRDLGPERTLVLVNGRRLGPGLGDGRNYSDVNQIPAALIDHVDVLTGGASATYGADAVAGVVNFVLNTKFQGIKVDAGYSYYQHSNSDDGMQALVSAAGDQNPPGSVNTGFQKDVTVLMGSNFADDKGNATVYFTYDTLAPVLQNKYDYSACTLGTNATNTPVCGGSSTSAKAGAGGRFLAYSNSGLIVDHTVDGTNGTFRPFTPSDEYNYGPLNYYQVPNQRWTAGSFLSYDVNDHVTAYSETMFTRNTSSAQIAPSGDFGVATFIPCNDPLLTAQEASTICSPANLAAQGNPTQTVGGVTSPGLNMYILRRNVEGGPRIADFQNDAIRTLVGVRGDFASAWTYDVYAQRSSVDANNQNMNYVSNTNVANALNVVPNPVAGGPPVCASVVTGADTKCVPWNIWTPNGVTAAAVNYLSIPLLVDSTTTEYVVDGNIVGDMGKYGIKIPMANEGLKVSFGAEWRSESANFSPDLTSQEGTAGGAGGPTNPVAGEFTVKELFTEFTLPIADHMPFADSLSLLGGYRYSDYSEGFKTNTYKIGAEWAPVQDVKFRGSFQRAVRAPNIAELYSPQSVQLDGTSDPCAGSVSAATAGLPKPQQVLTNGVTYAQCLQTGVTDATWGHINGNSAGQYNGLVGGNPALTPETALTYAVGFVLQPHWVPSLNLTVDYFDVKVEDTIGGIGANNILNQCISTDSSCNLIHRDDHGSLWLTNNGYVIDTNINFGSLVTKGIDVKLNYTQDLAALGKLAFSMQGTKLIALDTQPLDNGPAYNCVGLYGASCGNPVPAWRSIFSTTWSTPWDSLDVTMRWRYTGPVSDELSSNYGALSGAFVPATQHFDAVSYFDLSASFALYKTMSMQLGVNNILDKDPPVTTSGTPEGAESACPAGAGGAAGGCNGNTYPGTYDVLGRYIYAHVTVQF